MWSRLRRKTMAPSRPLLYDHQIGLLVFTVAAIAAGLWFVVKITF
jgi:hypothetical protein